MAKGKQAAAAATRRLESAMQHIDRLTDQLADAKVRVKAVEKEAARVPGMEREMNDLRSIVAGTAEHRLASQVNDLRDQLREATRRHEENITTARKVVARTLRIADLKSRHPLREQAFEWDKLAQALGTNARDLLLEMNGIPGSFAVGAKGPEVFREVRGETVLSCQPIDRSSWADALIRRCVDFLDDETDETWTVVCKLMRTVLADEPVE